MISVAEMIELENNCGIAKVHLMENAGKGIYNVIKEKFPESKRILIAAYHGNNGGDGFVAARLLSKEYETDVLFVGDEEKFKEEAKVNFKRIEDNLRIQILTDEEQVKFDDYDIIIDALLGTGVKGEIKEPIASVIDHINSSKAYKIAVDVPSGINPDTGEEANKFIEADLLITFHDIKKGVEKFINNVVIIDIGIKKI